MHSLFQDRLQEIDSLLYFKVDALSQELQSHCHHSNPTLFAQCYLSRNRLIKDTMDIYETKKLYRQLNYDSCRKLRERDGLSE